MVFLEVEEWTGIVSAVAAAVTAWNAFHDTTRKLTRYSNTVEKVKRITLWWEGLTPVAKANVSNLSKLVMSCEDSFERERYANPPISLSLSLSLSLGIIKPGMAACVVPTGMRGSLQI
eukprot:COSAG05_NODE_3143_length_2289_cov_2.110502_2_plen_118_part_00